jgi:hypothetical protein
MKRKYAAWLIAGTAVIVSLVAVGFATRPATITRPLSPAALAIISAPDALAGVSPFDLQCNAKIPGGLAQCGSQASSCKNCHEVKGEDPVNSQGDWHISHAFGDFCEFCHGGNVQAPDKAAAHEGLVTPLGDVQTNCSSCHADDYQARAEKYAGVLGVTVSAGGSSSGGASGTIAAQPDTGPSAPSQPVPQTAPQADPPPIQKPVVTSSNQIVDYTQPADAVNMGNVILGILLAVVVAGGGAFVFWNERRLRKLAAPLSKAEYVTYETNQAEIAPADLKSELAAQPIGEMKPELAKLLPVMQQLDPRTLRALRIILSDRRRGEELLQSLSLINFGVLEEMKRLDKKELSLLLALASES